MINNQMVKIQEILVCVTVENCLGVLVFSFFFFSFLGGGCCWWNQVNLDLFGMTPVTNFCFTWLIIVIILLCKRALLPLASSWKNSFFEKARKCIYALVMRSIQVLVCICVVSLAYCPLFWLFDNAGWSARETEERGWRTRGLRKGWWWI